MISNYLISLGRTTAAHNHEYGNQPFDNAAPPPQSKLNLLYPVIQFNLLGRTKTETTHDHENHYFVQWSRQSNADLGFSVA